MDTDTENEIVTVIDGDSDRPPGGMVWGSFYETVASIKDSLKVTHDIANGLEASITFTESIKALLLISEAELKVTSELAGGESYSEATPSLQAAVALTRGARHHLHTESNDLDAVKGIVDFLTTASQIMGMDDGGDGCDVHRAMCGRIIRHWDIAAEKETQH